MTDTTQATDATQAAETYDPPLPPDFAPAPEAADEGAAGAQPLVASPVGASEPRRSWLAGQPMRLMLVVVIGVIALFFAFGLLIIFAPTTTGIAGLAVIATPIAAMVASYYGITLSMQQVREERAQKREALDRLAESEKAARDADVWAAQMESGLRVAKVKLDAAKIDSADVAKAAGVDATFF